MTMTRSFHVRALKMAGVLLSLIVAESVVRAQCNATNLCPQSTPCCSSYGYCGANEYCIGGCDPIGSFAFDSCTPVPTCKSANYSFSDTSIIWTNGAWLGNTNGNNSNIAFTLDGGNFTKDPTDSSLVLLLTQANGGTRISSVDYIYFGTITAFIRASYWPGVVTAFITMSDVKDEIDWEFPGNVTGNGQSNFYFEGETSVTKNVGYETISNTAGYHAYTIDWKPDVLTWLVDGVAVRNVTRNSTYDAESGTYQYPSTPSRAEVSIWPAGLATSAPGTVQWGGGYINWNDSFYEANNAFTMNLGWLSIECYEPSNGSSYVYQGSANNFEVVESNTSTVLNITNTAGSNSSPTGPINSTNPGEASTTGTTSSNGAGVLRVDNSLLYPFALSIVTFLMLWSA